MGIPHLKGPSWHPTPQCFDAALLRSPWRRRPLPSRSAFPNVYGDGQEVAREECAKSGGVFARSDSQQTPNLHLHHDPFNPATRRPLTSALTGHAFITGLKNDLDVEREGGVG